MMLANALLKTWHTERALWFDPAPDSGSEARTQRGTGKGVAGVARVDGHLTGRWRIGVHDRAVQEHSFW